MSGYYSVKIPWSATPTEWHPTSRTGPFSVLTRGAFKTQAEAHRWAEKHLRGEPYEVVYWDYEMMEANVRRTSRKPKRSSRRPKRRSRRNAMMWKAGKESRGVAYEVNLEAAPHIEQVLFTDAEGRGAVLKRFLRPVVWFKPTDSQTKKIIKGKGKINITNGQITDRAQWIGRNPRRRKSRSRR